MEKVMLSRTTLCYMEFLKNLYDIGSIGSHDVQELAEDGIQDVSREAARTLYTITLELVEMAVGHYRKGRKNVYIYRHRNKRYVDSE